jgi:hypothetical protein
MWHWTVTSYYGALECGASGSAMVGLWWWCSAGSGVVVVHGGSGGGSAT